MGASELTRMLLDKMKEDDRMKLKKCESVAETWTDDWGVTRYSLDENDEESEGYTSPNWDYVFDESNDEVICPNCKADDLRYHEGECRCISCRSTFTDQEITDYAGPWRHGRW